MTEAPVRRENLDICSPTLAFSSRFIHHNHILHLPRVGCHLTCNWYSTILMSPPSGWNCAACSSAFSTYAANPALAGVITMILVMFLSGFSLLRLAPRARWTRLVSRQLWRHKLHTRERVSRRPEKSFPVLWPHHDIFRSIDIHLNFGLLPGHSHYA